MSQSFGPAEDPDTLARLRLGPRGQRSDVEVKPKTPIEWLEEPLAALPGLSVRTQNMLEKAGVLTVRQLLKCCPYKESQCKTRCWCDVFQHKLTKQHCPAPPTRLRDIPNLSDKTLEGIFEALRSAGFRQAGKPPTGLRKTSEEKAAEKASKRAEWRRKLSEDPDSLYNQTILKSNYKGKQ